MRHRQQPPLARHGALLDRDGPGVQATVRQRQVTRTGVVVALSPGTAAVFDLRAHSEGLTHR